MLDVLLLYRHQGSFSLRKQFGLIQSWTNNSLDLYQKLFACLFVCLEEFSKIKKTLSGGL